MSAVICPTILAEEVHGYRVEITRVLPFASRLHVDLMDGIFAKPKSIGFHDVRRPGHILLDLHVMYQDPTKYAHTIQLMRPHLVVVHAEADGDFVAFADKMHQAGIYVGVAVLPETPVDAIAPALGIIDHALVFSGHLGHYGGVADLSLVSKVHELRALKPELEIGWDGGINPSNIKQLADAGVDVLNVGGYIQHALNATQAYATLKSLV